MPVPNQIIRVNPLDLQNNISIGVSLPFNAPSVFYKTYTTQDQIKSNLINLLLTEQGERVFNPTFGTNLRSTLFNNTTNDTIASVQNSIITAINTFIPSVTIISVIVDPDIDNHILNVTLNYQLPISGNSDQIIIQLT